MKILISASTEGILYFRRISEERRVQVHARLSVNSGPSEDYGTVDKINMHSTQRLMLLKVNHNSHFVATQMEGENPFI